MHFLAENVVKPLTSSAQLSYAEVAGPRHLDWYVTHFWGMPVRHTVEALCKHAQTRAADSWQLASYWVCLFSNNQWAVELELGHHWSEASFHRALSDPHSKGTLVVVDEQALVLSRSWCLFEIVQTIAVAERRREFEGLVFCSSSGVLSEGGGSLDEVLAISNRLAGLQMEWATASSTHDKQMIDNFVMSMPGGFRRVNQYIRTVIREALAASWRHTEQDSRAVEAVLDGMEIGKDNPLLERLEEAAWTGEVAPAELVEDFAREGVDAETVARQLADFRRRHSEDAGVSVAYLLSDEFLSLARARSEKEDPTFYELKETFFLAEDAIGRERVCPRDGRRGCAFVDTLPPEHRRACTHFLSWTWGYTVLQVRSALQLWVRYSGLDPAETFLFFCFFVNNQYRILVEQTSAGSDDLDTVFEGRLRRIGKMVALLDRWDGPVYLTRIWTIFEQFTAIKAKVEVRMIMPEGAVGSLLREIQQGQAGIYRISESLCNVNAEHAVAWSPQDESKVKDSIRAYGGFQLVNREVQGFMVKFITDVVGEYLLQLVDRGRRNTAGCVGNAAQSQTLVRAMTASLGGI